ncbi:hypothetical protein RIF29_00634 [Crotalaria pallida]|uniref:RING-type domain-containing protein n=1 Tax=Crotalaria pallida TaxID=3830 RepID=A0AAN9IW07_CROPI
MEEGRRRVTLYEQMTAGSNTSRRDSLASLFLDDVVLAQTTVVSAGSRTLLDIIKEDDHHNINTNTKDRKSWKAFKDKLRLKPLRPSTVDTDIPIPIPSPIPIPTNNTLSSSSSQFSQQQQQQQQQQQNDVVEESNNHRTTPGGGSNSVAAERDAGEAGPVGNGMLLMDLLEETDPETEVDGSSRRIITSEEDEEVGSEEKCRVENNCCCCVCMVRHKDAAFIPCGHTFCRMCCREIWVSRRNCPLCNNFILEILDLF